MKTVAQKEVVPGYHECRNNGCRFAVFETSKNIDAFFTGYNQEKMPGTSATKDNPNRNG